MQLCRSGNQRWLATASEPAVLLLVLFLSSGRLQAQKIPAVGCHVENSPLNMVTYWQSPEKLKSVQVVVLKDPSGEQEALFDLTHGGTLISLRYHAKELLFGKTAGANVSLYIFRHHGNRPAAKEPNPYWSAFHPDQGGSSMGIPSTVAGVACNGERSMRAIAMMVDAGVDNSFQRRPLLVVWTGHVGNSFPIGSSTPFTIETEARWVKNPGGSPHYYLQPSQNVVNIRPKSFKSVEWSLEGASPWDFDYTASYPERCTEKTPCRSADTSAIATGRYQDAARTTGFAIVVPTASWKTNRAFVRKNAEYVKLMYGSVWAAPRHVFAVVLRHDVEGLKGFHFSWTVCAGSWKQAKQFAEKTGFGTR